MRTLSRPMFNMGGPIKQGIMHGIREPYAGGGKAALVGNPVYPKTGGREHHFAVQAGLTGLRVAAPRILPHIKRAGSAFTGLFKRKAPSYGEWLKNRIATGQTGTQGPGLIKSWFQTAPAGKYLAGSPEGRLLSGGAGWAGAAGQKNRFSCKRCS